MRIALHSLVQSWRACSIIVLILAVVSPAVAVAQDADNIQRIERQIEALAADKISIMPQGLDRVMSQDELRDLLAYLESLR